MAYMHPNQPEVGIWLGHQKKFKFKTIRLNADSVFLRYTLKGVHGIVL
ncbi:hypothetical protein QF042_004087 [Pedobacter sp. W3I1]|nr:hypothetical protein [Pedobacter sp. W3I1]